MKLRIFEGKLKNLICRAEISLNRRYGREFIPLSIETFCIEISSSCNLKCRFCAYEKKSTPRVNMSQEVFVSTVKQALEIGYKEFHLTPCTGDVFMDTHVFDKFAYLDANEQVRAYHFFTNLTIPDSAKLERLLTLKKLTSIVVSIYGHDKESFIAITKSSSKVYQQLLTNLEILLDRKANWPFSVSIGFRSTLDVPHNDSSDLLQMIRRYKSAGVSVNSSHGIYNNWGGYVTQADVGNLNLYIRPSDGIYKSGACVKLFDSFQVTASGIVNGCSCRDVNSVLRIGDINKTPLRKIISKENPEYLRLIEEQQVGQFPPVCSSCDYYRSVYHQPSDFRRNKIATQTITKFLDRPLNPSGIDADAQPLVAGDVPQAPRP